MTTRNIIVYPTSSWLSSMWISKKKLQQALHYIMLCLRRSVVVEDGVNESRGSVVSHPETNFNHQFVGDHFPHVLWICLLLDCAVSIQETRAFPLSKQAPLGWVALGRHQQLLPHATLLPRGSRQKSSPCHAPNLTCERRSPEKERRTVGVLDTLVSVLHLL